MALAPITPRRVVVTGIGLVTPLGCSKETFWDSLVNGRSGIRRITRFDAAEFPSQIAGEVIDFDPSIYIDRKELRHMDDFCQFGVSSAVQAVMDSGLDFSRCDCDRAGVIYGSGIGGMKIYEEQHSAFLNRGMRRISPFFIPMLIADIMAGHISILYNLRGPNYATTSACATSAHAIGCAAKAIRFDEADIIVSGGSEAPITAMGLGGFCNLKALSTRNGDPQRSSRPFDAQRDGFIMSEGAAAVILEEYEHAVARGAHIYGEMMGAGFTADAFHITAPAEDAHGAVRAMKIAMREAGWAPADVDYINAHGTSTELNDKVETMAIKSVFGEHARRVAISSTKSMHGHMLGAAGAVEMIASLLAMEYGVIPPTINYEIPDPECDLNYTPNQAVRRPIKTALSNSFGFGGHNACLAVKRLS